MKRTKGLAALLAFMMVFTITILSVSAVDLPSVGKFDGKLVIIHTNDTHGHDFDGTYTTAAVAQLKKDYIAAGAEVLLISGGDFSQGTPLVNQSLGAAGVDFMNAAGYDIAVPGNHEFDWGTENFLKNVERAKFPIIANNILNSETNELLLSATTVFTKGDYKIGIVGVDTPETATKTHPDKIKGTKFLAGKEMFDAVQKDVDALQADGCDFVIIVGHLGDADESIGNRSIDLLEVVKDADLFIDAHSHTQIDGGIKDNSSTLRVSTGSYLDTIGVVVYDGKTLDAKLIKEEEYKGVDSSVYTAIEDVNTSVDKELEVTFAKTEVLLDGNREPGVRTQETNLGNLSADALLWAANNYMGDGAADVAITNGGGIRDSIPVGDINFKHIKTVFPFGNTVATIEVTGAELLEILEAATYTTPDAIGAFPQVSGLSFTIDTGVAYEKGEAYPAGSTYFAPKNPGTRILNLKVNGEAVNLTKKYIVATNDFTASGGDTYGAFYGKPAHNIGLPLEDALVDYIETELGGIVSEKDYGSTDGRITIKSGPYTDIKPNQWFYDAVLYANSNGLIAGIGGGLYGPDQDVTKQELLTILYRMYPDAFEKKSTSGDNWTEAANYLNETLTLGFDRLESAVTREEMAYTLLKVIDAAKINFATGKEATVFKDNADINAKYVDAVKKLSEIGVLNGSPDGDGFVFTPKSTFTRGEFAQIVSILKKTPLAEGSLILFPHAA
ncbi:MAG: 5'-nucleotidase C-terminal domain-containing protein [Clostridiales bacterium]|jgi:2',3'-cyclic-nucleotide 2'-phosphodiesterase (5'-nucleotidase family)|nr:5'-nucleotidase C-terminal domain-containing protein [Clostridiales bacterium]